MIVCPELPPCPRSWGCRRHRLGLLRRWWRAPAAAVLWLLPALGALAAPAPGLEMGASTGVADAAPLSLFLPAGEPVVQVLLSGSPTGFTPVQPWIRVAAAGGLRVAPAGGPWSRDYLGALTFSAGPGGHVCLSEAGGRPCPVQVPGPVWVAPAREGALVEVEFPRRGEEGPGVRRRYRGVLRIHVAPGGGDPEGRERWGRGAAAGGGGPAEGPPAAAAAGITVVNVLPVEAYLRAVLPYEVDPGFPLEALKALAVAARSYILFHRDALAPWGADICDSDTCQLYLGVAGEDPRTDAAVAETRGLVATYQGEVIEAVHSSSAGGHTENVENVWAQGRRFPGQPVPYLKGVPDLAGAGPAPGDRSSLETEEGVRRFLRRLSSGEERAYDGDAPYARWTYTWSRSELEAILEAGLAERSRLDPGFVEPYFPPGGRIGELQEIRVLRRGVSGRAMAVEIRSSEGRWVVQKELNIRGVFRRADGQLLPSALVVFDMERDAAGRITRVSAWGAGRGHGVGLSQWGARGRAEAGFDFEAILRHYYAGIHVVGGYGRQESALEPPRLSP